MDVNNTKFKINDIVEITFATGFEGSKIGDKATVTTVYDFMKDSCFARLHKNGKELHLSSSQAEVISRVLENRQFLQDFIKLNQIKTTLISKYLGHSPSWLTTMANEKRRGDLSDESLKAILKKLHIDWSSSEFINVKATKEHTAYRTRPNAYTTEMHKERLQKSMWSGLFVK